MPDRPTTAHVEPGTALGRLLDTAAESDIVLEMDGVRFRLFRIEAYPPRSADPPQLPPEPDRLLNSIGLGASQHGSDSTNLKDQYIADAVDRRE